MRITQPLMPLFLLLVAAAHLPAGEFKDLFNGRDLDGWVVEGPKADKAGNPMWRVEDGKIICLGKGFGFLRYERRQFADFVVRVEYRFLPPSATNKRGNSGLGIRTIPFDPKQSALTRPSWAAYEIQLMDDAGKPADVHSSGSLYRYVAPTANPVKAAPAWNTLQVECRGPRIKVAINGTEVLEADQRKIPDIKDRPAKVPTPAAKPLRGYISLQSHTGTVEFRKVQVRELIGP